MFTQLKNLLPKEINKHGLSGEVHALLVINAFKKHCIELLGEESLKNLVPRFFKNKKLYIDVANSSWAQNLHLHKIKLILKINESLNQDSINSICIHIVNKA